MADRIIYERQQRELELYYEKQRDCECRRQVQQEGLDRELAFQESRRQRIMDCQESLRQLERELCKMERGNQEGLQYRKGRLSQLEQEMQQMELEHQGRMRQIAEGVIAPLSPEEVYTFSSHKIEAYEEGTYNYFGKRGGQLYLLRDPFQTSNFFGMRDGQLYLLRDPVQGPVVGKAIAPPAAPPQTCYVAKEVSVSPDLYTIPEAPIESTQEPIVKEVTAPPAAPPQTCYVAEKLGWFPGLHIIPGRSRRALVASLDQGMSRWYSRQGQGGRLRLCSR